MRIRGDGWTQWHWMAGKCALARREVVSLVDVEFAATGPVKIDLTEIPKFAFAASRQRGLHSRSEFWWDRHALGYSIMLESWDLENDLATAGYVGNLRKPYRPLLGSPKAMAGTSLPYSQRSSVQRVDSVPTIARSAG
jgi:hypothetical protein